MKKILVIVMVLVAGATSTFAVNPAEYDVFYKLNNPSTFTGLMKYLDADGEQAEYLKLVFTMAEDKMKAALKADNEADAEKAMNFNLGNAKNILTSYQYKKYLTIINLTVNNRYNEEVLLTEK
ncbi:MAG: hypothetical protein PHR83_16595 [Paludibacter sp.]|nr:hypothetical protein [Paludibacter sp.]